VDLVGGLPGREPGEASWDAQAQLEGAMLEGTDCILASLDYRKYFDSFDIEFTVQMLRHAGLPEPMLAWWRAVYADLWRVIKIGHTLGRPFQPHNGVARAIRWR
jgi:hypothetical protein